MVPAYRVNKPIHDPVPNIFEPKNYNPGRLPRTCDVASQKSRDFSRESTCVRRVPDAFLLNQPMEGPLVRIGNTKQYQKVGSLERVGVTNRYQRVLGDHYFVPMTPFGTGS
jgi:hypothetical protein